jgi:hypothetical protein
VEKRDLSKFDFEMIDDAFKALLESGHPNPVVRGRLSIYAINLATPSPDGWRLKKPLRQRRRCAFLRMTAKAKIAKSRFHTRVVNDQRMPNLQIPAQELPQTGDATG